MGESEGGRKGKARPPGERSGVQAVVEQVVQICVEHSGRARVRFSTFCSRPAPLVALSTMGKVSLCRVPSLWPPCNDSVLCGGLCELGSKFLVWRVGGTGFLEAALMPLGQVGCNFPRSACSCGPLLPDSPLGKAMWGPPGCVGYKWQKLNSSPFENQCHCLRKPGGTEADLGSGTSEEGILVSHRTGTRVSSPTHLDDI